MEVGKNKKPSYIFGYLVELIIIIWQLIDFVFEIWRIWVIFFMENPSYKSKSYFSGRGLGKIRQQKKRCCSRATF
jgi:hypothetical protein